VRDAAGRVWRTTGLVAIVGVLGAAGSRAWRGDNGLTVSAAIVASPGITAGAAPAEFEFRASTAISGTLSGPGGIGEAGQSVALLRDAYPYAGYQTIEHATTAADGSYVFGGLVPDRDTRYEVEEANTPGVLSAPVAVVVDTPAVVQVMTLAHGEVTISVTADHSRAFDWNDRSASWYVSTDDGVESTLVAQTLTHETEPGTTRVAATFYPPSGTFTYRVCFTAPGAAGLGPEGLSPPGGATPCEATGTSVGHPSPAVPDAAAIAAAERFLDGREGRTAFAVVDTHGQLSGVRMHERFYSASLIKAMLLVAFLRRLGDDHRGLTGADRDILGPMIHISDNDAASAVFAVVGESGLSQLAAAARMTDFSPSPAWGLSEISAADQARFFSEQDQLIPPEFVAYARSLLSNIDPSQRWGIPAAVDGRYEVFFKGGWLPDRGIVNQAARLEGHGEQIALSILTSGGPGMGYGEQTLEGTTARLLG
jgi:hypothetical protein